MGDSSYGNKDTDMVDMEGINHEGEALDGADNTAEHIVEEDEEEKALRRMSEQARRRREMERMVSYDGDGNDIEEEFDGIADDEEGDADEADEAEDAEDAEDADDGDVGDEEGEDDDLEGDGFDDEDVDPVGFLRRLIRARANERLLRGEDGDSNEGDRSGAVTNREEDNNNNIGSEEDDNTHMGHGFADIVQRIMRGGTIFSGFARDTSEMQSLINNLNQRSDTYLILETLNELSERLLMMNGITAERKIPASKLANSLVSIMQDQTLAEELEINLVACRCLYNFLEVNQDFIHDALNSNAIECLCDKLLEISCIDLTEQALQTLEMISRETISHNRIIASNGLKACLQYLDFLTVHAQRRCLVIVANSCANISDSNFQMIKNVFHDISEVLRNHNDSAVIENGWIAISRIIMSFKLRPNFLEELFCIDPSILKEMTEVIVMSSNKSQNSLSSETSKSSLNYASCLSLIRSLILMVSVSVELSRLLLENCSIGETIVKSLNKWQNHDNRSQNATNSVDSPEYRAEPRTSNVSVEALMSAPRELLTQLLTLIGYLLPITYAPNESPFLRGLNKVSDDKQKLDESRVNLCREIIPEHYWKFVNDIWNILISSSQLTMDFDTRKKVIISITRIVTFAKEDDFPKIKGLASIGGLLASIINQGIAIMKRSAYSDRDRSNSPNSNEMEMSNTRNETTNYIEAPTKKEKPNDLNEMETKLVLLGGLIVANTLIRKAPAIFMSDFEKEGLISDCIFLFDDCKLVDEIKAHEVSSRRLDLLISNPSNKFTDFEFGSFSSLETSSVDIQNFIILILGAIKDATLSFKSQSSTDGHQRLGEIEMVKEDLLLLSLSKSSSFDEWRVSWARLKHVISDVDESTLLSSFELISSGIIEVISKIFTTENAHSSIGLSDCCKAFMAVFYVECDNASTVSSISILVKRLQEALTRAESFEIVSSSTSTPGLRYAHEYGHTFILAKQVKLKLVADNETAVNVVPPGMHTMTLSVHAIATFKSVENFLKQRYKFLEDIGGSKIESTPDNLGDGPGLNEIKRSPDDQDEGSGVENFEFLINDEVIPTETTIYGAIYRSLQNGNDDIVNPSRIWPNVHMVTFRRVNLPKNNDENDLCHIEQTENELESCNETTINILNVLKMIFEFNSLISSGISNVVKLPNSSFMNWKLTVKLNRQLEEPLVVASGTLPSWSIYIPKKFSFLFPLDTRIFLLQSTSFGYSRLIHHWQVRTNQDNSDERNPQGFRSQLGRPTRHKVRISRKLILQSAVKVLSLYGSSPGILEIEYFDEEGSGLGPTLEFYATVSKEFAKRKLKLWRDDNSSFATIDQDSYVSSHLGLFPSPLDKNQLGSENGRKVLYFFHTLGKFVARALLDSRILDLNFNLQFLRMAQYFSEHDGQRTSRKESNSFSKMACLKVVDPDLAKSLEHLSRFIEEFENCGDNRGDVTIDGMTIENLSIFFVLPGYPLYELIPNGENVQVTSENVEVYINKVLNATLYYGVINQIKAFIDGFSKVFPIKSMAIFSPEELTGLFGSTEEDWSFKTLFSAIQTNHGYSKDSVSFKRLLNILVNLNPSEKRVFLQFLTGSPRLPIGGFKALRPEFTVVRKVADNGLKDDDYLPSVMTCANYLKLPNYSSEAIMKEKLLQAIKEGANAFLLS